MKNIALIDKKFDLREEVDGGKEFDYYKIPDLRFALHGVFLDAEEGFLRMPMKKAEAVSDGVANLTRETSGGRIRFSTDSSVFQLKVEYEKLWPMAHMALVGQGGFCLFEEREKDRKYIKILPPAFENEYGGYTATVNLQGGVMRNYILYFPLYQPVKGVTIGLEKGAKVGKGKAYRDIKPILYYGSSITQGGCASRSDNCYQAFIEKWNNIDYINLGFSGNGKGEEAMVEHLCSIDCSFFVCDYNHSGVPLEWLKNTHFRLYERFRKVHPDTPILILTKTNLWEDNDYEERVKIIHATYRKARKLGDKKVYFLSGKSMWNSPDKTSFAIDGDHPNDLGFYLMAKKIYKKMVQADEKFRRE